MKRLLMFILTLSALCATAQEIQIKGDVSSVLTREGVSRAVVRLMTMDGETVLAIDTTRYQLITERGDHWSNTFVDKHSGATFSLVAPAREGYMLVVEAKGFEEYRSKVVPENGKTKVKVPAIYLIPCAKEQQLGEAEVRGTRIKMFHRGDTIIYNADAFNLAQTESLRKLVQQLPGAELNNGEIKINGKRVDNLLISGKDFFNGNIQAALDNLPAYVVSRIKVYDKAGELSELTGKDMHDENYVMDVRLKRQYIGMWMAKISADGGTDNLRGGQAFLMRADDRQMFSVNADVNNFNLNRQMMDIANTEDTDPSGRIRTKTARLSYYMEPNGTWRLTASGSVSRKDSEKNSWRNEETYLSSTNLMNRIEEHFDGEDLAAEAATALRIRKSGHWQHTVSYDFNFSRNRNLNDYRALSYYLPARNAWSGLSLDSIIRLEEAKGAENALLNSLLSPSLVRQRSVSHRPVWKSTFVFGSDLLNFNATLKHATLKRHDFANYRLTTYADPATDARRRYRFHRDYTLDLNPELEWVHKYEHLKRYDGVLTPRLRYTYRYGTSNHPEYRLERMTEWAEGQGWALQQLGQLPSTSWQSVCLDEANSYYAVEKEEKAEAGLRFSHKILFSNGTSLLLEGDEAFYYQRSTLNYDREGRQYRPLRSGFFFKPDLTLRWKRESREGRTWMPEWSARYQGRPAMPSLLQLLPIRDASDPLNRFLGNEQLGNSFTHQVGSAYRLQHIKSGRSWNIDANYRRLHNDIAMQSSYDAATAVRTYQPVNTSRTHAVQGSTRFSTPLDVKKRFYLSVFFDSDYYQAENRSSLAGQTAAAGLLRNVGFTPGLGLQATIGDKFRFYGRWTTAFRHVRQPGMSDDYRETVLYGDLSYTLPFGIQLATFMRTVFYAGNSQALLNQTVTNWDASLSKYFFNDRLGLHFKIHDLLAQNRVYQSEVTTTGRIERYTDVLPRYFMLTLSYNINWMGKKK